MDEIAQFNKARWEALAAANIIYSRPLLDLDAASARRVVDPFGVMGDVAGKNVLCLASGGGQQSVAFALLGAQVTVLDLSETQLERDRQALAHYGLSAQVLQGDMRDLSRFADASFDLVWHAFSINFIPDTTPVFNEVQRVLRPGSLYRIEWHNPFSKGMDESDWNGKGYSIQHPYVDGELQLDNPNWDVYDDAGGMQYIQGPREFNHTLSTVINGLLRRNFMLLGIWEELSQNPDDAPGSWEHMKHIMPPWLTIWARYRPDIA